MNKLTFIICIVASMFVAGVSQAHTKVVVVPMMGGDANNLKNIITVAKEYGDFTSPIEAINSIPDTGDAAPSETNPYLIVVGPGVYDLGDQQITMKPWISIVGSGQEVTTITGAVSTGSPDATTAVVVGASNVVLADLSIINTGGAGYSYAIFTGGTSSPRIERVTASASGHGSGNGAGIVIRESSAPILIHVTGIGENVSGTYGMACYDSSAPIIRDSLMQGNYFMMWSCTNARIVNTQIDGSVFDDAAGTQCRGVYNKNLGDISC